MSSLQDLGQALRNYLDGDAATRGANALANSNNRFLSGLGRLGQGYNRLNDRLTQGVDNLERRATQGLLNFFGSDQNKPEAMPGDPANFAETPYGQLPTWAQGHQRPQWAEMLDRLAQPSPLPGIPEKEGFTRLGGFGPNNVAGGGGNDQPKPGRSADDAKKPKPRNGQRPDDGTATLARGDAAVDWARNLVMSQSGLNASSDGSRLLNRRAAGMAK